MNTREQLNTYLRALERRLRWLTVSKGIAVVAGVALGATLALVVIVNSQSFSEESMTWARVALFLALGLALGYALVIPLTKLNRKRAATSAEKVFPQFEERLLTYVERADSGDPMLELLADDTQKVARQTVAGDVAPRKSIFAFATGTGAAGAALLWMILAGPGFLGYGAKLLWAGAPKSGVTSAFYDIQVHPGNKLVRRKDDVPVSATLIGFQAQQVRLFARYQSSSKWEQAVMLPRENGSDYEFRFAALPEPVEYYVEAGSVKSKTYKLDVTDLPGITHIKTTYHFPAWLALPDQVEDPSGDLRAVSGTTAEVLVTTDRPLKNGVIELEDGTQIPLQAGANGLLTAKVPIQKSGLYHFAAQDQGQSVRLSPLDYFIEAQDDQPPSVRITHPGADAKVLPIEEVTIEVTGQDDFALQGMDLHYSVNGAAEKVMPLLQSKGSKSADAHTTLSLEDFKLQPGDVISMYATAKDARNTAQTDIVFVEAQAYERNYTQSQQAGGGGGGGGGGGQQAQEIWDRQKQVITATYNATRPNDKTKTRETADYLSSTEITLKAQAESLSQRMKSRELDGNVAQAFQTIIDELKAAGTDMATASDKLKAQGWKDSLPPENSALRHLDHVQAAQRDIQIAFSRGGGGGGGGGANAGRDLENLFDLELDTEKNQYEQQAQGGNSQEEQQKKIDDAMAKLDELAKRQQDLAKQPRTPQNAAQQRYEQEQLRKQAEQLQRDVQQMQQQQGRQGQQGQQSQSGQQSAGQQSGGQQSGGQQSGGQQANSQQNSQQQRGQQQQSAQQNQQNRTGNASAQQLQQTLDRLQKQLQQSIDAMKQSNQAAAQGQQGDAAAQAEARRAAQSLGDAGQMLRGLQQQDASGKLSDLAQRASDLAQQQHAEEDKVKQQFGDVQSRDKALADKGNQAYNNFLKGDRGARQQAEEIAKDEEKLASQLSSLQDEVQRQEQSMRSQEPKAASALRDGLAATRQSDAQRRLENMASFARNGYGPMMAGQEAPVTSAIDGLRDQIQKAQQASGAGNQQAGGRDQQERSLAEIERQVQQLQNLVDQMNQQGGNKPGQNGQKGGQQPGGQQPGGQQPGGQQAGGKQGGGQQGGGQQGGGQQGGQQGGGQQGGQQGGNNARAGGGGNNNGGAYNGGPNGGFFGPNGGAYNPSLGANRNYPQGVYDNPENRNVSPAMTGRELQTTLQDLRQAFKDDPTTMRAIGDLEKGLEQVRFGETASPELAERIGRVILPEWESFEVQMRRKLEESGAGQAKTVTPDKVPAGFDANVQEYTRKLSTGTSAK